MNRKIKILYYCKNYGGGVYYYRMQMPAILLNSNYSDDFNVEIVNKIDFNDSMLFEYLSSFDIIHYHTELIPDLKKMREFKKLYDEKTKLIADIDDYWRFDPKNSFIPRAKQNIYVDYIENNILIADAVTTTNNYLLNKILEVRNDKNVFVLENGIDPELMKQFKPNKIKSDNVIRIGYIGGSTHTKDVELLDGIANLVFSDDELKDKVKFILGGFNYSGVTPEITFNQELAAELASNKLVTDKLIKEINNANGDVDKITSLPAELKEKYRDRVLLKKERPIKVEESPYYHYENIFTDNYKSIKDIEYCNWLKTYENNKFWGEEKRYGRRWVLPVTEYVTVLNECDILLAPLYDSEFNRCKSELKMVEGMAFKLPIICSDIEPYKINGVNMENCILVPNKKNSVKYWYRAIKKLVLNSELRNDIGNNLYNKMIELYNLNNINKKRIELYNNIIENDKKNN